MAERHEQRHLEDFCRLALERQASDLHLKSGKPPALRIEGQIHFTDSAPLEADEILTLVREVMDERVRREFEETGSADFSYTLEGGDRFRVNAFRQRGQTSVAARRVARHIPGLGELNLPAKTLEQICEAPQGLVIFAGVTGCGKSTSIAACLDSINRRQRCHIVTIEDPIEFLFDDKEGFVNQREIGTDVPTFELALKYLMREDPDVVLVGEVRDRNTCESVLRAAETGHLVFTTVHAPSIAGAIRRLLDLFKVEEHEAVRQTLASNLVSVVCQKLLAGARPETPRLPATEILITTPMVRKLIREGGEDRLADLITGDTGLGMHDFTQDLARLVREGHVDVRVAYEVAPNPEALKAAIRGIASRGGAM